MYRVLIVDDEKEICNGLVQIPPWAEWGVQQVFAANDGDTALEIVEKERPDLIITDIKMQRVSGIEMIKRLQEQLGYTGKVIVISGYDDFMFVKEALKLGVVDYVLKPINKNEFARVVQDALQKIYEERMAESNQQWLNSSVEKALPKIKEGILQELIEFNFSPSLEERTIYQMRNLNLDWLTNTPLALIVTEIDNLKVIVQNKDLNEKDILLFSLGNVLRDSLAGHVDRPHVLFQSKHDLWVILIGMNNNAELAEDMEQMIALQTLLTQLVGQFVKIRISTGISAFGKWDRLHHMFLEAVQKLEKKKIYGTLIDPYENPDQLDNYDNKELDLSDPLAVVEMMKYGSDQEIFKMMSLFPAMTRKWNVLHPRDLQHRSFEWILAIFRAAQKAGWQENGWEKNPISFWERLEQYDMLDSLQKYLTELVADASRELQEKLVPQSHIIQKAEQYIVGNFMENISLVMTAEYVYVTPVWLSRLFKKEKGMTFHEFLTDLRLEKARMLLHDVDLKIYHICNLVGYQDPVYFTKLYKKKYGCTPQTYRKTRGIHVD